MDKFGYIRGRRGPPGPAGKDTLKIDIWCPQGLLELLRKGAFCHYYLNTNKDGVIGENIIKDRTGNGNNAVCHGKMGLIKTEGTWGVMFQTEKSYAEISKIVAAIQPPTILAIAISFKCMKPPKGKSWIFTNESETRGVSIDEQKLDIWGCKDGSPELKYIKHGWNTLMIQYSRVSREGDDHCYFVLNGKEGFFRPEIYEKESNTLYLGHPVEKSACFTLNSFEVYSKLIEGEEYVIPQEFRTFVIRDLESRVEFQE